MYMCKYLTIAPGGKSHCSFKEEARERMSVEFYKGNNNVYIAPRCPDDVRRDERGCAICYITKERD